MQRPSFDTGWTRALARGARPDAAALREHLVAVHASHAGFTEACAARCRDPEGRDSYDWLAEAAPSAAPGGAPGAPARVLDLACGSGVLLDRLARRAGGALDLVGVDMSADELALARARLAPGRAALHRGLAQEMGFLADASVDAVLCHWALTLMDPVVPALAEARRVLRRGGTFAAIVDGAAETAPGYAEVDRLIFAYVREAYPMYGDIDLGDPRVREAGSLANLVAEAFGDGSVSVEPNVVSMTADPETLAREASGFFYAAFVLGEEARAAMLEDLASLFARLSVREGGRPAFHMPINRLVVAG
ncbi:MAG: class I SAM-dependent methyltransferase [Paracoccaceae bacterium]